MNTQSAMIATPAMINQLAMASIHPNLPMAPQTLMAGTQGTTMINNQPLYIRTTGPITPQIVNNIQQQVAQNQPAKQKVKSYKFIIFFLTFYSLIFTTFGSQKTSWIIVINTAAMFSCDMMRSVIEGAELLHATFELDFQKMSLAFMFLRIM